MPQRDLVIVLTVIISLVMAWWLYGRIRASPPKRPENRLIRIGAVDWLNLESCYSGVLFCAETGGGKSSTAEHLALALLRHGAGFLWLCPKADECERAIRLCRDAGREEDIIRIAPDAPGPPCFDFITHELRSPGGSVQSAAELLSMLIEVAARQESKSEESFWRLSAQRHLHNAVAALWHAYRKCPVESLYAFLTSAPGKAPPKEGEEADPSWRSGFAVETLYALRGKPQSRELVLCLTYWIDEWPRLSASEKTAAIVTTMTVNIVSQFVMGPLAELVCGESTAIPDDVLAGKVLLVDCPELVYQASGRFLQIIWKVCVQKSALRRKQGIYTLPIVVYADEFQLVALPDHDVRVQSVARSHKLIQVCMFQSLEVLYSALGGSEKARHEAEGIIGNLAVKLLGANSSAETNLYWEKMLGHTKQLFLNGSTGGGQYDLVGDFMGTGQQHTHAGFSENVYPNCPAHTWTTLAKGGRDHGYVVETIVYMGGRIFKGSGKNWIRAAFRQRV